MFNCKNRFRGCNFQSQRSDIIKHKEICLYRYSYEQLIELNNSQQKKIDSLIVEKEKLIDELSYQDTNVSYTSMNKVNNAVRFDNRLNCDIK